MGLMTTSRNGQRAVLAGFVLTGILIVLFMLAGTQVHVPLLSEPRPYHVTVELEDSDNLVPASDVRIAGVHIGDVQSIELGDGGAVATLRLDSDYAPLHQGVQVRVGEKSVVGETYVEITDGNGEALRAGSALPAKVVQSSIQLGDVLRSLDAPTRISLRALIRSLGAGTDGTREDVAALVRGLGDLGKEGHTALDAIAAQSQDLQALTRETATVLEVLDVGEGQIADLVGNARQVSEATAGQSDAVKTSMRLLPSTLDTTRTASSALNRLAAALAPVATDLRKAAPDLRGAIADLPETTQVLRSLLPDLDATLVRAPRTLRLLPAFGRQVRATIPEARAILTQVNPMLEYLRPYGPDIASWVANFSSLLQYTDETGVHYGRLQPSINEGSIESPLHASINVDSNPYPGPGLGGHPGPYLHNGASSESAD